MIVPIIPALNPDHKLIKLVDELTETFNKIIIVNDGSESDEIFKKLQNIKSCVILNHCKNLGKGEALKTAFCYYLKNLSKDYCGVVTIDADGQHTLKDVIRISEQLEKENKFILGTRLFNTNKTPLRNKLGNKITSKVFKMIYKVYLKDTQTGLRGIPNRLIKPLSKVEGSRFEYELNVLISLVKMNEDIIQYDIRTIYLKDSNKKSHFKVLKDSYQIYKIMFRSKNN